MDDTMGMGTPTFFSSAWSPEQSDFPFTGEYQSNIENYTNYAPQFQQGQAENNQLDYFSTPQDQFNSQLVFQPKYPALLLNDDLDMILPSSESLQPQSFSKPSTLNAQMQDITTYDNPTVFGVTELEDFPLSKWSPMEESTSPARLKMEKTSDSGRRTSVRYGQITPVDSPPEDSQPATQNQRKASTTKSKQDDPVISSEPPKLKKPRRSKKKALTKEQEEAKRKKFLERNRVAADKCRQNRKKWIDDLQAKVHFFNSDNAAKKAALDELEQEIVQLRSMLFIHARGCNEKDILDWVEQEARRVELETQTKVQPDDGVSTFSQETDEPSSPLSRPSTRGFGAVSDAISRRYNVATADDAVTSPMMSGCFSSPTSRRTSFAA
jgi:bZIP transcription factor